VQLTLGLILAGLAATLQSGATDAPEADVSLTVQVKDYAQVDPKTLAEAERVAARIFHQTRVETRWANIPPVSNGVSVDSTEPGPHALSVLRVQILSQEMSNRLGMADNIMGLAPGSGPDRRLVYVLYDWVRKLAKRQIEAENRGDISRRAALAQILGEMMAHELGHVLLNLSLHSQTGIMRGDWDLKDLGDVAYGCLFFTRQQAEIIRADVRRRGAVEIASFVSQPSTPK
jgi:hypothetical protein